MDDSFPRFTSEELLKADYRNHNISTENFNIPPPEQVIQSQSSTNLSLSYLNEIERESVQKKPNNTSVEYEDMPDFFQPINGPPVPAPISNPPGPFLTRKILKIEETQSLRIIKRPTLLPRKCQAPMRGYQFKNYHQ